MACEVHTCIFIDVYVFVHGMDRGLSEHWVEWKHGAELHSHDYIH